jgi:hypothetical protein
MYKVKIKAFLKTSGLYIIRELGIVFKKGQHINPSLVSLLTKCNLIVKVQISFSQNSQPL